MSNLIQQGTLNRLRGSVVYALYPYLNVTAPYLAKEGISIGFEGDTSQLLGTMTGAVTSPEPYIMGNVTMHLLRSQSLSNSYKTQIESFTTLGSVDIITDSDTLSNFSLENCVLQAIRDVTFDGNQPGFIVNLKGVYNINSTMFAST